MSISSLLKPPPPAAERVPVSEMPGQFAYWRNRLLWSSYIGYAVYYMLRKNIPVAAPLMTADLGISITAFGIFFTLHDLTYGAAKLIAGMIADRSNPRVLVPLGLFIAAISNVVFGFSSSVAVLGIAWVVNGFFQGFGFPPTARILSYWFKASERGVKWAIFNTSHQVGTFAILVLSGYLGTQYGWRSCFLVPALLGIVTTFFLYERLRDSPDSLGLPPIETYDPYRHEVHLASATVQVEPIAEEGPRAIGAVQDGPIEMAAEKEDVNELVRRRVFRNPAIWLACLGNFFVYTVRYGILNWAPTFLTKVKHTELTHAGMITGAFELAGLVGCLTAGYISDRVFQGRRAPACVFSMLACSVFVFLFWKCPEGNMGLATFYIAGVGFTVYGPQFLGGVMAADLATKRAAGTAVGLHGFFGYLSGLLSGYGLSSVVEHYGWDGAYKIIFASALLGALPFVPIWKAGPAEEGT